MSNYNTHQQVFILSMISNAIRRYKGTQADLQTALENTLPRILSVLGGQWRVTWGPVVWKTQPNNSNTGPDHVWFVVHHPSLRFPNGQRHATYVLAIAGSATRYNRDVNDFGVNRVVDFPAWINAGGTSTSPRPVVGRPNPNGCYTSLGTTLGAYVLSSVAPPSTAASSGLSLPTYWTNLPSSPNVKVVFTGHGLGAALSSTLTLALFQSRALHPFSPRNILFYPTAGPSPGNGRFSNLLSETFPPIPGPGYQVWNYMIVNYLDIVSQAWSTSRSQSPRQNMENIPPIYGRPIIPHVVVVVRYYEFRANSSRIRYFPTRSMGFTPQRPHPTPTTRFQFLKLAEHHHMEEFWRFFGIRLPRISFSNHDGIEEMTDEEFYLTEPLFGDLYTGIPFELTEEDVAKAAAEVLEDNDVGNGLEAGEAQSGDLLMSE